MQNLQYRAKALQTRRLPNGGDVGAGNDERRETMAGRGDRAAPRGQAQAPAQAVAAGTSSRLSLLMLCGRNYIYVCERLQVGSPGSMSSNFGLTLVLVHSCARAALDVACFLVVADVERALDDEADYLRREAAGEFRCEGRSEGVEVVALVGAEAARRDNFPCALPHYLQKEPSIRRWLGPG